MAGAGIVIGVFGLVFYLFILLLPVALLVALQVWLCRKSTRLGLILPGISLALSLLLTLSLAAFGAVHGGIVTGGANYVGPNGQEVPAQTGAEERVEVEFHPRTLIVAGVVFLVSNIPTAVFGGIWLHYKGRRDTLEDLKRMQIEDLD